MPQGIPEGLTREHILQALAELDVGAEHPCGKPTGYELLHDGKRYPPKAVISLAHRHLAGQILGPEEFSGGEAPGQANAVLRRLKFNVVKMMTRPGDVEQERERRREMWSELSQGTGPTGVTPRTLRKLGIYGGAQGIWVDQARTRGLGPSGGGVTVGVLHTGRSYADDLDDDCIIYHYPRTRRRGSRDRDEVDATKAAGQLGLPLFVIIHPSPYAATRNVRLGWIEAWDDASATFLVSFEEHPAVLPLAISADEATFQLIDDAPKQSRAALARRGQQRFKFRVFKRYGPRCVACGLDVVELLDAAHLHPKQARGSDDPRNGLVLCATHHRAFDTSLFAINPDTLRIHCREGGPGPDRLGISHPSLGHLEKKPHADALRWAWNRRQA